MLKAYRAFLASILLIGFVASSNASEKIKVPDNWGCWATASYTYGVPITLLKAIAKQESGFNPYVINKNSNSTYDLGLMQINSSWLKAGSVLSKMGIGPRELLNDPCLNLYVGAWVLRGNINKLGYNWRAVGAYNAASEDKRIRYANNVWKHVKTLEFQYAVNGQEMVN